MAFFKPLVPGLTWEKCIFFTFPKLKPVLKVWKRPFIFSRQRPFHAESTRFIVKILKNEVVFGAGTLCGVFRVEEEFFIKIRGDTSILLLLHSVNFIRLHHGEVENTRTGFGYLKCFKADYAPAYTFRIFYKNIKNYTPRANVKVEFFTPVDGYLLLFSKIRF